MSEMRSAAPGFLITFEGVEGGGKSTQVALLDSRLRSAGIDLLVTREPGGSPLAESVRTLLLDPSHAGMAPLAELHLILAARAEHVAHVVRPALAAGRVVVIDRFTDATIAYQSGGRGLPEELVTRLAGPSADGLVPDLTFLLDLAPEAGFARRSPRARRSDRLEGEDLSFHHRVRSAYLRIAEAEPARFVRLDASADPGTVHNAVYAAFRERTAAAGWPG